MSNGDRSQDEIAASAIISMSNQAHGSSTDGEVRPAIQVATPMSNATRPMDRRALHNQQELLRHFLTSPASRIQHAPSLRKQRKADKTILTWTQRAKILKEFAKAKSENKPMKWTELSQLSLFKNRFTPEVLRTRGLEVWKAYQEEEEQKKRVTATKLSVLNTFIKASNDLAKMQETLDEIQAEFNKLKLEEEAAKIQSLDSEKTAAGASDQLEKLRQDLANAESVAESTKLRQHDLEKEIAESKAMLQSAEDEKKRLEVDLERTVELDVMKKRLEELHKAREVQEVEAASLAKITAQQELWISGLNEQLDIQAAIASKANSDNKKLMNCLNEKILELERVKAQLDVTQDTMDCITSVESAVKSTAVFINNEAGLRITTSINKGKCSSWLMGATS